MRSLLLPVLLFSLSAAEFRAPAGNAPAAPRPGAVSVLPGGRLLDPHGRQFSAGPSPFGLAVSPNGKMIVTADIGPGSYGVTVLRKDSEARYRARQIEAPREGSEAGKSDTWRSVSSGIAFADTDELFVSEGDAGRVRRMSLRSRNKVELYELNAGGFRDSLTGDLAYDARRKLLYVIDQANFRLVVFDFRERKAIASLPVGRLPFAIDLSPDRKRAYVTHVGMFEYRWIPGASVKEARVTGLPFPAFGFPSPEAMAGARRETLEGPVDVPGLGDPNVPESNSLCVINVEDPARPRIERYIRTGKPVGEESRGGSSPSGVVATEDRVYVANAHNDSITVVDKQSLDVIGEIPLRIPEMESLRGVMPAGLDYHRASGWLLVAEPGINAVGVIDTKTMTALGHVPAAWFPVRVRVHQDTVYVANAKGHGTGANANRMTGFRSDFLPREPAGSVTLFPLPAARDLPKLTRRVLEANGFVPVKGAKPPEYPPEIRHVVLIVKESRSFDEVFGDIEKASNGVVDGAPMLARFGRFGSAGEAGGGFQRRFSLRGINVTPNHHAMAQRGALSDNFYSDGDTSVEGHHWLAGVPPNAWTLSTLMPARGGQKESRGPSSAPGRLQFAESNSSVHPEEIPEAGTLWHHLERHGITFRNFGEGFELAGVRRGEGFEPTGVRFLTNVAMPEALFRNTSRDYPEYNTFIPDQYRATRFIEEIEKLYGQGEPLPRFLCIHLPNDDMARARAEDGYPFTASYVADNDYALGRIVDYLSKTPWWKNMAIFVTEDEASGGVDHVDSHRTVFLALGPYVKRNHVSHTNASFPALHKTIFGILGIPALNLFDAAASDLSDCFTATPDFTPYEVQPVVKELFDPAKARPAQVR